MRRFFVLLAITVGSLQAFPLETHLGTTLGYKRFNTKITNSVDFSNNRYRGFELMFHYLLVEDITEHWLLGFGPEIDLNWMKTSVEGSPGATSGKAFGLNAGGSFAIYYSSIGRMIPFAAFAFRYNALSDTFGLDGEHYSVTARGTSLVLRLGAAFRYASRKYAYGRLGYLRKGLRYDASAVFGEQRPAVSGSGLVYEFGIFYATGS